MLTEKRILIVEDESIISMDIRKMLRQVGFKKTMEASSADEALKIINKTPPDMVLMDIILEGDKDGISLADILRKEYNIPVIYITAHSDRQTVAKAVETDPVGFITKPVKLNDLYSTLVTALHKNELEKKLTGERDLLLGITEISPVSIMVLNAKGRIVFANPMAEQVLGVERDTMIGRYYNSPEWHIADPEGNPFPEKQLPFKIIMKTGKPVYGIRHSIQRNDGIRVILSVNGAPVTGNSGEIERVVFSIEDITTRVGMETLIKKQNQDLLEQNEKLIAINNSLFNTQNELLMSNLNLRENQEMLNTVVDTIPVRVFWKDRDLRYLGCNRLFAEDAGLQTPDDLIGKTDVDLPWAENAERYHKSDLEVMETGASKINIEELLTLPDGSTQWHLTSRIPMKNQEGRVIGIFCSYEDITERKKADEALKKSEERMALVMEATTDGIWDVDFKTGEIYVNPAYYKMLGLQYLEIPPTIKGWAGLIHPEDREKVFNAINNHLDGRVPNYEVEFRIKTKSNGWLWVMNRGKVVKRDLDGRPVRMAGMQSKIHERKTMEQAIRESEEKYRNMIQKTFDIVYTIDKTGNFVEVNDAFLREGGYERDDILGRHFSFMLHPEDEKLAYEVFQDNMKGIAREFEMRARVKQGKYQWYYYFNTPILNHDGTVASIHGIARNIMERKLAEVALKESERRYRLMVENATDVVMTMDLQGYFTYVNPPIQKLTGYTQVELTGAHFTKVIPSGWRKKLLKHYILQIEKRIPETLMEFPIITKTGRERWVELIVTLHLKENVPIGLQSIIRDITEQKRSREDLRKSEEKYRFLVETINDVIYTLDPGGNVTYISPTIEQMSKYRVEEILGRNFTEFIHPEDLPGIIESYNRTMTGIFEPYEFRIMDKDGSLHYVRTSSRLVMDGDQVIGLTALMTDMTDKVKAELSLRESESKFRALTESTSTAIGIVQDDNFVYVNPAFEQITGYTLDDLKIMNFMNVVHPDFREEINSLGTDLQPEENLISRYEAKIITKTGQEKWADISAKEISFNNKPALIVTGYDITERKTAEEALRSSEERLSITLNSIGDAVIATDISGTVVRMNPVAEALTGWSNDEARRMPASTVFPLENAEDHTPRDCPVDEVLKSRKMLFIERNSLLISRDGTERHIADSCAPIRDNRGNIMGTVIVFRDVTSEIKLQDQLRQSQKMESIGRLAGGIAHDFNNLLTTIIGFSEMALDELQNNDPVYEMISDIMEAGKRGASLTQQLLAFSRKQMLSTRVLNLNDVVTNMEKLLGRLISENIILANVLDQNLGMVKADPFQVEQILMNLAVNSRDAMPDGGYLTIETSNVILDDDFARIHTHVRPGRYVMLSVSDTGYGMDQEVMNHVFEPFYTTKEKGKGTGLGLSTVYGIVKQHAGTIMVYSEVGKGTSIKIYLPMTEEKADEPTGQTVLPEGLRGTETILVAEDNPEVLKLARVILTGYGYTVLEALTPGEAINKVRTHHGGIHLLLTDVIMPGLNGPELHKTLTEFIPELKVVYMSGYTDNAAVNRGILEGEILYLQKPFTTHSLISKIRTALDV